MPAMYLINKWEYGQGENDPIANNAPDCNMTLDKTVNINTDLFIYIESSTDPDGDVFTDSDLEILSSPPGWVATFTEILWREPNHVPTGWRINSAIDGPLVVRARIWDDGGAGRGKDPATPLASPWETRTYTFVDPNENPDVTTIDLTQWEERLIPYGSEYGNALHPAASQTCYIVTRNSQPTVEVNIFGDEGSRNGAAFRYGPAKVGTHDEVYITHKMEFDTGFRMKGPAYTAPTPGKTQRGGGGKIGVAVGSNYNDLNQGGGGNMFEWSANFRIIFENSDIAGRARLKMYDYVHYMLGWMEAESGDIIDNIPNIYNSTAYKPSYLHRFNHWQMGGDRGATGLSETGSNPPNVAGHPRHPGDSRRTAKGAAAGKWSQWGSSSSGSRYVGKTVIVPNDANPWTFTFNLGEVIEIEQHFKMNTFHATNTFNGGTWMPGTWHKPNKDGVYELWARKGNDAPMLLFSNSAVVYRYEKYATQGINRIDVGGAAGGNYEDMDGRFWVWDVRFSEEPIITA